MREPVVNGTLSLRRATLADVAPLVALVNSAYRGDGSKAGWTTEADLLGGQRVDAASMADTIRAADGVLLVYEQEGELAACVNLERTGEDCYLGMLTISPTLQASGLGRRMLAAGETFAHDQWQAKRVHMTVIGQRAELVAWYERRGYRRTGKTKPFPYEDERFGLPTRDDLYFEVLEKLL